VLHACSFVCSEIGAGVSQARTLTILYIVFAELLRAYSSRSLRVSIWKMGTFSNTYMQYAVGSALLLTVLIVALPGVRDVFSMAELHWREWVLALALSPAPFVIDEFCKFMYRTTGMC
jgi:Ca2+-transporting ATPase